MKPSEPTTIGLSSSAHEKLKYLQEAGCFRELLDGYRFAIGLALVQNVDPPDIAKRVTIFNVGTVDPDQTILRAIEAIMGDRKIELPYYRMAERLAEWGVNELHSIAITDGIDLVALLEKASILEKNV